MHKNVLSEDVLAHYGEAKDWGSDWGKRTKFSLSENTECAPIFYSKLAKTIDTYKGEKVAANNITSYLKARGVKDEEIKWSGISTYLEGKKSVSKDELVQFIRDNDLEVTEVERISEAMRVARSTIHRDYQEAETELQKLTEHYPDGVIKDGPLRFDGVQGLSHKAGV